MENINAPEKSDENTTENTTVYDDTFKLMFSEPHKSFVISLVNYVFQRNYTAAAKVMWKHTEHVRNDPLIPSMTKRIGDLFVEIEEQGEKMGYHIECESTANEVIFFRIVEYGILDAFKGIRFEENPETHVRECVMDIPNLAIVFLRAPKSVGNQMMLRARMSVQDGLQPIDIIKMEDLGWETVVRNKLVGLTPFVIFNYDKQKKKIKKDTAWQQRIVKEYENVAEVLNAWEAEGVISKAEKQMVGNATVQVVSQWGKTMPKLVEGVKRDMYNSVMVYMPEDIARVNKAEGLAKGIVKTAKRFGATDDGIIEILMEEFKISKEEAAEYLSEFEET